MWTSDLENGLACDEHADEAREKWVFYAIHPYEMACSMVGIAVYSEPLNRCIIEEDGQTLEAKAMHEPLPVR
jgi:hypothetical protein